MTIRCFCLDLNSQARSSGESHYVPLLKMDDLPYFILTRRHHNIIAFLICSHSSFAHLLPSIGINAFSDGNRKSNHERLPNFVICRTNYLVHEQQSLYYEPSEINRPLRDIDHKQTHVLSIPTTKTLPPLHTSPPMSYHFFLPIASVYSVPIPSLSSTNKPPTPSTRPRSLELSPKCSLWPRQDVEQSLPGNSLGYQSLQCLHLWW